MEISVVISRLVRFDVSAAFSLIIRAKVTPVLADDSFDFHLGFLIFSEVEE